MGFIKEEEAAMPNAAKEKTQNFPLESIIRQVVVICIGGLKRKLQEWEWK